MSPPARTWLHHLHIYPNHEANTGRSPRTGPLLPPTHTDRTGTGPIHIPEQVHERLDTTTCVVEETIQKLSAPPSRNPKYTLEAIMHLKRSLDIHIPAHVQQDLNSATPSEKTETRISDLRDELTTILTQLPEALRLA